MKSFEYRGFDRGGAGARGLIEALDPKDARERLSRRGILVERLHEAGARASASNRGFQPDTRAVVYRELGALLVAGLPLDKALDLLIQSPEWAGQSGLLAGVRDRVREGLSLHAALAGAVGGLPPFEEALIEVGERTGALGKGLDRLAGFLEQDLAVREKASNALVYPLILLGVALIAILVIVLVLFPVFSKMLAQMKIPLPWITRAVLAGGRLATVVLPALLLAAMLSAGWVRARVHASDAARVRLDRLRLALPVWGRAARAMIRLRFCRSLAALLQGGVPIIEAVKLAGRSTGNAWVAEQVAGSTDRLRQGVPLADTLVAVDGLDGGLTGWVRAGEASADLPAMLESASQRYQQAWERQHSRLLALLSPAVILVVGALVLAVALAVLLPLMSLNRSVLGG
ncbi:MAG: type II secretion system F family protein [Kiritimatiellia bacterium]